MVQDLNSPTPVNTSSDVLNDSQEFIADDDLPF